VQKIATTGKTKLVSKKRGQELYNKVLNGELSIEKMKGLVTSDGEAISTSKSNNKKDSGYTSKELTYVEAVTEWIDKMN